MAVDAKKLAARLRKQVRQQRRAWPEEALDNTESLAEAVELVAQLHDERKTHGPGPLASVNDWLRRVAEAHAEGGDDGS